MQNKDKNSSTEKKDKLLKRINENIDNIQYLGWDIQNFSQFAKKNGKNLIDKQSELANSIQNIFADKQGDLERIRTIQFEYNKLVRKSHNEILNAV